MDLCARSRRWTLSLHALKSFLQDLPILQPLNLIAGTADYSGFLGVLGGFNYSVKNSKGAREWFVGELIGSDLVSYIVRCWNQIKDTTFARVGSVEGAFIKFHAFAKALDEAEAIMVHGGLHHLQHMRRVGMGGAGDEGRARGDGLFHWVNGIIDRAPSIGFALESKWRSRRSLLFSETVNPIIHHDISHFNILAGRVIEMISANRKGIAITTENENVKIGARKGNATGKRQRAAMNIMGAVGLNKIGKATGTTDAGHGSDFFMVHLALFDQLKVKGQHRKIATPRTPS